MFFYAQRDDYLAENKDIVDDTTLQPTARFEHQMKAFKNKLDLHRSNLQQYVELLKQIQELIDSPSEDS